MEDLTEVAVTFKYNGHWIKVKGTDRMRFYGGKQKTLKIGREKMTYNLLKEKVLFICPWLERVEYKMYYHICGSSPKNYMQLNSNTDVMVMTTQTYEVDIAEVLIITKDSTEDDIGSHNNEVCTVHSLASNLPISEFNDYDNDGLIEINDDLVATDSDGSKSIVVGTRFKDATSFKQALQSEAIMKNFGIKMISSNRTRVIATCAHQKCPWRVRASVCHDGVTFEVRRLENTHICPGINRAGNKQATTSWIAHGIIELVKVQADISPKEINNNLEAKYGLSLPYIKLWRAREEARNMLFGSVEENYNWVPALQQELTIRNPGSHIVYTYERNNYSFKRFFVSFKVCVDGFLVGCRHFIGLDACHLKSKYLGVLLSANSLDGNNGMFTLAFAVAESESKNSWKWFLEQLSLALDRDIANMVIISDMEKGLGEAIKIVFPNAEHRICLRHLWKNLKKFFRCDDSHMLRSLVWSAANAYTVSEFNVKMRELLHICPQVHSYLLSLPYKWCRSAFSSEVKNHYNTNNVSESFNAWIRDARSKLVVDLVDLIRAMLMQQRADRKATSLAWRGELVPYAENYIRKVTTRNDHFIIRESTNSWAEVENSQGRYVVDINKRICTCNFWQLTGLPCAHAAALIGSREHTFWHFYVDVHYHIDRYRMAYEGPISPLPSKDQWCVPDNGVHIGVPNSLRPRGRPKKNRFKNFLEGSSSGSRANHRCGRYGLWGHHRTTCKNPLNEGETASGSMKLPIIREEDNTQEDQTPTF